ncbi:RHS repeat-associated core domain-containing protein [Micromonospora sp. NPDC023888]|uniref:RHS repeat domain-containing protein n=1 Tax=Micromonospora sp. NPDC023888 TaxID=3155607 RepID=UPI0033D77B22
MSNEVPALDPGQFDVAAIGKLARNVNMFRGDLNYPQNLVQLPGVPGDDTLAVGVALQYRSNVSDQVDQWNLDAPTGIVGLGWYLAWDRIEACDAGSVSATPRYVLWSGGVSNALVPDTTPWLRAQLDQETVGALTDGPVSAEVVAAFAAQCLPLDVAATVTGDSTAGWTITDPTWERVFAVAATASGGDVYDGGLRHQAQDYLFWQISYYPQYEKWELTTDSAEVRTFGGGLGQTAQGYATSTGNSVEWAVKWGGPAGTWTGPSTVVVGQAQYARAWNLSTRRDRWGSSVAYAYNEFPRDVDGLLGNNAEQQVGAGLPYTKAVYPTSVTSVAGQVVAFRYGAKTFTAEAQEYLDPHKQLVPADAPETPPVNLGTPNAYQDRYQTLYLQGVDVLAASGDLLFAIELTYTAPRVVSTTPPDLTVTAAKRYLAGVTERNAYGASLPGYAFTYYVDAADSPNVGALCSITYPQGAVATWSYAASCLDICDRATPEIAPPSVLGEGATPMVWSGSDYVVSLWLNAARTTATLDVYTWLGRWSAWCGGTVYDDPACPLDTDQAQLVTAVDTFALALATQAGTSAVTLYSRTPRQPDQWGVTCVPALAGQVSLTAGDGFVAAVLTTSASYQLYRWAWDWRCGWTGLDGPARTGPAPLFALGHAECLLVAATSTTGTDLSLCWLDATSTWQDGGEAALPYQVDFNDDYLVLWDAGPSLVALSFAEGQLGTTYGVQLVRWDLGYQFVDTAYVGGLVGEPIDDQQSVSWPPPPVVVDGAFVAARQHLFRFDSGTWYTADFATSMQGYGWLAFAYGDDVAVQVANDDTDAVTGVLAYDPDGGGFPDQPTPVCTPLPSGGAVADQGWPSASGGDFIVARNAVYYRGTSTTWTDSVQQPVFDLTSTSQLAADVDSLSIVNQAPAYLAYLVTDAAEPANDAVQLLVLRNGGVLQPLPDVLSGSAYYVPGVSPGGPNGQLPTGPLSLVAYAANEGGFGEAACYRVFRYAGQAMSGPVTDYPVSALTITDGFGASYSTAYEFDAATATCDPSGQVVKYYRSAVYDGAADPATSTYGRTVFSYLNGTVPGSTELLFDGLLQQTVVFAGGFAFATDFDPALGLDPDASPGPPEPISAGLLQAFSAGGITVSDTATVQCVQVDGGYLFWSVNDPTRAAIYNIDYTGAPDPSDAVRVFTGTAVQSSTTAWTLFDTRSSSPGQDASCLPLYGGYVRPDTVVQRRDGVPMATVFDYVPPGLPAPFAGAVLGRCWQLTSVDGTVETHLEQRVYGHQVYPALLAANLLRPVVAAWETVAAGGADPVTASSTATIWSAWPQPGTGVRLPVAAQQWAWTGDPSGQDTGIFPFDGTPDPAYWQSTSTATVVSGRGVVLESTDPAGTGHATVMSADGLLDVAHVANASFAAGQAAYSGFEPYEDLTAWSLTGGAAWDLTDAHTGSGSLSLPGTGAGATLAPLTPRAGDTYVFTAWCRTDPGFAPGDSGWTLTVAADGTSTTVSLPFPDTGGAWSLQSVPVTVPASSGEVTLTVSVANTTAVRVRVDDLTLTPLTAQLVAQTYDPTSRVSSSRLDRAGHTWHTIRDTFLRHIGGTTSSGMPSAMQLTYLSRQGNPSGFAAADPNASLALRCLVGGSYQTFRNGTGWQADWTPSDAGAFVATDGVLVHASTAQSDTLSYASPLGPTYAVHVEVAPLGGGPLDLTDDFAMTVGDAVTVTFDHATGQWGLTLDGTPITALATVPGPPTWCLLTLVGGQLLFHADGQLLFAEPTGAPGAPAVVTGRNALGLANLVILDGPALRLKHGDATGTARLEHLLTDEDYLVAQSICDGRARRIVRTQPTPGLFGSGASLPVLVYRPGLVDLTDFLAGLDGAATMTGDVSDWYDGTNDTDDGGYPYRRWVLEPSPLARQVELGFPGADQAIVDLGSTTPASRPTVQFGYGSNSGPLPYGLDPPDATVQVVTRTSQAKTTMTKLLDAARHPVGRFTPGTGDVALDTTVPSYGNGTVASTRALPDAYAFDDPAQSLVREENAVGQLVQESGPDTGTIRYLFDRGGRVRFVQDAAAAAAGLVAYHTWDMLGRRLSTGTVTFDWTPATTAELQQYAQDPAWPQDQTQYPYQETRSWTYDGDGTDPTALGQLVGTVAVTDAGGSSYQVTEAYGWASSGVLASRTVTVTRDGTTLGVFTTSYGFDNQGRITQIGYPNGADTGLTAVGYTYDGRDNVLTVADAEGVPLVTYTYNPLGRPVTHTYGDLPAGSATYDPVGRLSSFGVQTDGAAFSLALTYDPDSNPTLLAETTTGAGVDDAATVAYRYDSLRQLLCADDVDGSRSVDVGYVDAEGRTDWNGNVQSLATGGAAPACFTYTPGTNQLASVTPGSGSPTTYTYQPNGLLAARDGLTVSYLDTTALPACVSSDQSGQSVTFAYDVNGYRRVKQSSGESAPTLYVHAGVPGPVLTVDASGVSTAWVYGPTGLVAMARGGQRYSVVTDYLRSPRLVLDTTGALVAAYSFDVFGRQVLAHEPAPGFLPMLFTGQEFDAETGLYAFPARLYDPSIARFLNPDPAGQYASPYLYAGNQPTLLTDPTGQLTSLGESAVEMGLFLTILATVVVSAGASAALVPAVMAAEGILAATVAGAGIGAVGGSVMGAAGSGFFYSAETPPGLWNAKTFGEEVGAGAMAGFVGGFLTGGVSTYFTAGLPGVVAAAEAPEQAAAAPVAAAPSPPDGGADDIEEVAPAQDDHPAAADDPNAAAPQEKAPAPARPASRAENAWAYARPRLLPNLGAGLVGGTAQGATKQLLTNAFARVPPATGMTVGVLEYAGFSAVTSLLGVAAAAAEEAFAPIASLKSAWRADPFQIMVPAAGLAAVSMPVPLGLFLGYTDLVYRT